MARKKNVWKDGLFPFHCDAKGLNTLLLSTTGQTISVYRLTFSEKVVFTVFRMARNVLQIHR